MTRHLSLQPLYTFVFWLFVGTCIVLGWIGAQPIEYPFDIIGQVATFMYFFLLIVALPFIAYFEHSIIFKILREKLNKNVNN